MGLNIILGSITIIVIVTGIMYMIKEYTIIENAKRCNYQYITEIISETQNEKEVVEVDKMDDETLSVEFEDTVEEFDKSFFKMIDYIEKYESLERQSFLLQLYFQEILAANNSTYKVKDRILKAKEYIEHVQAMKKHLGYIKGTCIGYTKNTYYQWMTFQSNYVKKEGE